MKKACYVLGAVLLLYSCAEGVKDGAANSEDNTDNDHMTHVRKNTEHSLAIYKAIETGDVSKLDSFMTPDIIDHEGNMGKDVVGIDSLKAHLSKIHLYFDNLKTEVISQGTSLDNNYHFALYRMRAKAKENPWGIPTGTEIDDTGVDVVKVRDGKASEHWGFMSQKDVNEMMASMGGGMVPTVSKDSTKR